MHPHMNFRMSDTDKVVVRKWLRAMLAVHLTLVAIMATMLATAYERSAGPNAVAVLDSEQ